MELKPAGTPVLIDSYTFPTISLHIGTESAFIKCQRQQLAGNGHNKGEIKMELKVNTEELETAAPLYHQYPSQWNAQPAYISVTVLGDEISVVADWNGEIGNAVPMSVWNGLIWRIPCPNNILGHELIQYMESPEFETAILEMCDVFEEVWDGNNWVGRWNEGAETIAKEIEDDLTDLAPANIYEGIEWINGNITYRDENGDITSDREDAISAQYEGVEITRFNLDLLESMVEEEADASTLVVNVDAAFVSIIEELEENREALEE